MYGGRKKGVMMIMHKNRPLLKIVLLMKATMNGIGEFAVIITLGDVSVCA